MANSFVKKCVSANTAVFFIITACIFLVSTYWRAEPFSSKPEPPIRRIDWLEDSFTKASRVRNASEAEQKYMDGWAIPDDPGFVNYIKERWLFSPSKVKSKLPDKSYSQFAEDKVVRKLLQEQRNGFFLEAGALDGVRFSNTLDLELANNWSGLLVEPDPNSFAKLLQHHRNAYCINACLSSNKSEVLSFISNTDELAIASLEETNRQKQNINKKRIRVQCFPLYSIMLAVGTTKIDFFSLDVEGAEESVLDSLPMDKLDIGLFVIEYTHSNKTIKAERLERMRNFFSKVGGYKFHGTHKDMDAIFKKVKNGS